PSSASMPGSARVRSAWCPLGHRSLQGSRDLMGFAGASQPTRRGFTQRLGGPYLSPCGRGKVTGTARGGEPPPDPFGATLPARGREGRLRLRWLDLVPVAGVLHRAIGEIVEVGGARRAVEVMRRDTDKGAGKAAMGLV